MRVFVSGNRNFNLESAALALADIRIWGTVRPTLETPGGYPIRGVRPTYFPEREKFYASGNQYYAMGKKEYAKFLYKCFQDAVKGREFHKPEVWLMGELKEGSTHGKLNIIAIDADDWRNSPVEPKPLNKVAFGFKFGPFTMKPMLPAQIFKRKDLVCFNFGQSRENLRLLKSKLLNEEKGEWRTFFPLGQDIFNLAYTEKGIRGNGR